MLGPKRTTWHLVDYTFREGYGVDLKHVVRDIFWDCAIISTHWRQCVHFSFTTHTRLTKCTSYTSYPSAGRHVLCDMHTRTFGRGKCILTSAQYKHALASSSRTPRSVDGQPTGPVRPVRSPHSGQCHEKEIPTGILPDSTLTFSAAYRPVTPQNATHQ